ncbi:MAG: hypothetical protein ACXWQE_00185 [Bdellovibrionales bacterium]
MTRDESIAKGIAAMAQAESDALGGAYDDGKLSEGGGGITQEQVDAKIAEALAASQAIDQAALDAAHADADKKAADLQKSLDDMSAKDAVAEAAVQGFSDKIAALQTALDTIKGLISPAV